MHELFRRLRYLLSRGRRDRELANDMEFHREMAAREGTRDPGNTLRLREEAREAWGWMWLERFGQDLRYAGRMLRKSPGFTLAAVLMLAIGIGVNVAAFGFFNFVLWRPVPVRDPGSLLRLERRSPDRFWSDMPYAEMAFFRDHSRTLSALLAQKEARLFVEGESKPARANFVTANFMSELGAHPVWGRVLDPGRDNAAGAEPVAVLSYGFWERHFGADPSVVGKTIRLNDKPVTVAGVVSREFSGLRMSEPDVWIALRQQPYFVAGSELLRNFAGDAGDSDRDGVNVWARLRPGFGPKAAEDELRLLARELRAQYPLAIWKNESIATTPGGFASIHGTERGSGTPKNKQAEVYRIVGLVGALTLLILAAACGNLGGLLLARGVTRQREISIRVSVGAGKGRLARQLFTESILLALLGSAAGLALGSALLRALVVFTDSPAWVSAAPDWRVICFAVGLGFLAAVLFGLTPALQGARQRHRGTIMRQFLIGAQVAASCVLLIVAGLLVRALNHALDSNPGFDVQHVISIDPGLDGHGYSPAAARAYLQTFQARLRGLPGVESVALASIAPLGHKTTSTGTEIGGRGIEIQVNHVDPAFFQTMRIPLLRGRNLQPGDTHAVVISQSLARLWPTGDPLGRPLTLDTNYTVVGVAGSARLTALQDPDSVEAYFLSSEPDLPSTTLVVKTAGLPESLVPLAASIAKDVDPKVFPEIQMLKTSFRLKLRDTEHSALAVSLLGATALLLACLGIVGLVAYAVSQRTKEIGIRVALGARSTHVLSIVLRQFFWPVAAGLVGGMAGGAALSQILRRDLYGISFLDPLTYAAAIGIFAVTVALAALAPARRALRVDPMLALRYE